MLQPVSRPSHASISCGRTPDRATPLSVVAGLQTEPHLCPAGADLQTESHLSTLRPFCRPSHSCDLSLGPANISATCVLRKPNRETWTGRCAISFWPTQATQSNRATRDFMFSSSELSAPVDKTEPVCQQSTVHPISHFPALKIAEVHREDLPNLHTPRGSFRTSTRARRP